MLSKSYRVPREIDDRDLVFDARPKSAQEAAEEMIKDMKEAPEAIVEYETYQEPRYYDDQKHAPKRSPIDRIAELAQELTYGEMITWAGELWAVSNEGITEQNLADVLWDWAHMP
jgi:rubrerythrin